MPLSEQEQRLLEEMERSLYHNDADFVATVGGRRGKPNYAVMVIGILLGVLGIALLVAGVAIRQPLIGVLGFIVLFAGVVMAVTPSRHLSADEAAGSLRATKSRKRAGLMDTLNERWDRRQDEHGDSQP